MDLDIQNFGDYSVKPTFANDADYSNFIQFYPAIFGYAYIKNKKDKKKRDAQLQADLERIKAQEAENRANYAKSIEEKRKAENDKLIALQKEAKAKNEANQADKELKEAEQQEKKETGAVTPPAPLSNTRKLLIYGGIGVVVVVGLVVLLKRK